LRSGDERVLLVGPPDDGGPFPFASNERCGTTIELNPSTTCQPFSTPSRYVLRAPEIPPCLLQLTGRVTVRKFFVTVVAIFAALMSVHASAEGCLKGAAVGGVVGHVAGKHGVVGAAAGCAIGHHDAAKMHEEASAAAAASAPKAG
jgi:hypothetical protein